MEMNIETLNELIAQLPNGFSGCNNHVLINTDEETNKPVIDGVVIAMPTEDINVNVLYKLQIDSDEIKVYRSPSTVNLSTVYDLDLTTVNEIYTEIYKNIQAIKYELIFVCIQNFANAHNEQLQAGLNALAKIKQYINSIQDTNEKTDDIEYPIESETPPLVVDEEKPKKKQTRSSAKKTTKKTSKAKE
jgi:hypothetical protein